MVKPCLHIVPREMKRLPGVRRLSAGLCLLLAFHLFFLLTPVSFAADIDVDGTDCQLHDAITAANTDTETNGCIAGDGADTITLSANVTLEAALPVITTEVTIDGDSHTISGDDTFAIFVVEDADLTVKM